MISIEKQSNYTYFWEQEIKKDKIKKSIKNIHTAINRQYNFQAYIKQ